jgi:hypothetical protein
MSFILAEDAALKAHVTGLTVSDEKQAARPVSVWFGFPDVEIRTQTFPFITIQLLDIVHATDRQHSGVVYDSDLQGTAPIVGSKLYSYEYPVAYDLVYQVTSFSRHPRHDRALATQLLRKFPGHRGFLPVPNDMGTSTAYRHMFMDNFTKLDRAEGENGNKRLLRNIYTLRVVSEMTPDTAQTAIDAVTSVSINSNGAQVPWTISVPADKIPL